MRAFAMVDGLYLGIMWTVSFGLYVIGLTGSFLGMFSLFTAVYSLFFAAKRMRLFRDNVRQEYISYGMTLMYMLLMFGTACMLFAMLQCLYFTLLDNGFVVSKYTEIMSTKEAKIMIQQYGMTQRFGRTRNGQSAEHHPIDTQYKPNNQSGCQPGDITVYLWQQPHLMITLK